MQPDEETAASLGIYDDIKELQKELDTCMHCGSCMAVCPVYKTEKNESAVARGKLGVIQAVVDGSLSLEDPEVVEMLFNCMVCKSCMQNCPTKVNFDRIMLALRSAIVRKNGLPWLQKAIFSTMRNPALFDRGMKIGAILSGLAFRDAGQQAIAPRSPFAFVGKHLGFDKERLLPALVTEPLRHRLPEVVHVDKPRTKVAFFTGCSLNYFYPQTGQDLIEVLRENQVEVSIPKEQRCCGIPAFVHGDVETIRELGRANLDAMDRSGTQYLITGCGSCGGAWQHDYTEIFSGDPVYGPKAKYWSEHTYDISSFLVNVVKYRPAQGNVDAVVTYHDSCHLKKTMNVSIEPRKILKSIPGITFKELAKPDACCGSGGSYLLTHFGTATEIAKRKVEDANQTQADTVTTGCPACMMQLLDNLHRFGQGQQVRHYISLLAESYRNEKTAQ